jgi:creatinine amidohydrolase
VPQYKLEDLKYTELENFSKERSLFIVVVSPLEEHGPHLPLGVDAINAAYFADEISRKFQEQRPDWNIIRMPPLYVGSFAFEAPGTIVVRPKVVRELVVDYLSSLARYGFRYFLISNAHGGPTHIVALEEAARKVSHRYGVRVLSFAGHLAWEFLRGNFWPEIKRRLQLCEEDAAALHEDAHAGQWETSMMLKLRPDLVDPVYKELDSFSVKLIERIQPNYPLKREKGQGYVGHPARASVELAEVSSQFLLEKAYELVEEHLFSSKEPRASMFYRFPLFRSNFLQILIAIAALAAIVLWIIR